MKYLKRFLVVIMTVILALSTFITSYAAIPETVADAVAAGAKSDIYLDIVTAKTHYIMPVYTYKSTLYAGMFNDNDDARVIQIERATYGDTGVKGIVMGANDAAFNTVTVQSVRFIYPKDADSIGDGVQIPKDAEEVADAELGFVEGSLYSLLKEKEDYVLTNKIWYAPSAENSVNIAEFVIAISGSTYSLLTESANQLTNRLPVEYYNDRAEGVGESAVTVHMSVEQLLDELLFKMNEQGLLSSELSAKFIEQYNPPDEITDDFFLRLADNSVPALGLKLPSLTGTQPSEFLSWIADRRGILANANKAENDAENAEEADKVKVNPGVFATESGEVDWANLRLMALKTAANKDDTTGETKLKSIWGSESVTSGGNTYNPWNGVELYNFLYRYITSIRIGEGSDVLKQKDAVRLFEIFSLVYSKGDGPLVEAFDPDKEGLQLAYQWLSSSGAVNQAASGFNTESEAVNGKNIPVLEGSSVDDLQRMKTFESRMRLLYALAQQTKPIDVTQYPAIQSYYIDNEYAVRIPFNIDEDGAVDLFTGDIFSFSGGWNRAPIPLSVVTKGSKEANSEYAAYMIRTAFELPYYVKYLNAELVKSLSDGTIAEKNEITNALKNIDNIVKTSGWTLLSQLWEMEFDANYFNEEDAAVIDDDYNSLKKIWDAVQNNEQFNANSGQAQEEPETLTTGQPLPTFFKDYAFTSGQVSGNLTEEYIKGIAYTATLVPMKSNLYSQEWMSLLDSDFKENFYNDWGFNRKALYMDTSPGAGEAFFNSGKTSKGELRVVTLRDLIEARDDIVLYLDDNFYNINEISDGGELFRTYVVNNTTLDSEGNPVKDAWSNYMSGIVEESYNTSLDSIVKTGASTNYSKTFYELMSAADVNAHTYYPDATTDNPGNTDSTVLSSGKINYYLDTDKTGSEVYTPLQGYAVVSAIYRDPDLYNMLNSATIQYPVFIASEKAAYAQGASTEQMSTIFNWALIKNIEAAMPVGYSGNLDMDCPLYMDILGNIVTESGTIVVPVASNATIMNPSTFYATQYGAGLWAVYGAGYQIPVKKNDANTVQQIFQGILEPDEKGKVYIPVARALQFNGVTVDMSRLSIQDKDTLNLLQNALYNQILSMENSDKPYYNFNNYANICTEVLRGAPIENIDKEIEGLNISGSSINQAGVVAAAKLEELNSSLNMGGENTTISLPNLAFMPGFNYLALIVFKVVLLVIVFVNMAIIYMDAVSESLNLGTLWKCLQALVITMLTVLTIPMIFEATYYQSNRALLQNESTLISMLNLEKKESGVEIGVTEVKEPELSTELYLKLESIEIPWYELFYNAVYTDTYNTLNKLYDNYVQEHSTIYYLDDVEVKNDGVYVNVSDVYESSSVDFNMNSVNKTLVQTASNKNTTFSFFSPYYTILDALIQNVNYFNAHPWGDETSTENTTGWYAYTTKEQSGGRIKTVGLAAQYFQSAKFMEETGSDITGFRTLYKDLADLDTGTDEALGNFFTANNLNAIKLSGWYPNGIEGENCMKRIEWLEDEARTFVSQYRDLLGKISDETFLKVMAMDLAIKHNRIFGCNYADTYEIYNLSNDDLIRLSVAERDEVMVNSTLSYPRFVYEVGGTPAVFAAAVLSMIMWISGIVKPLLVIVAFVTIFVSIFVFKVCLRKQSTSLYGYFITALMLSGTNILYSLVLKASMFLPTIGLTPFMCIIIQCIIQITYMMVLLTVVWTAFRDWQDLGFTRYANKAQDMQVGLFRFMHRKERNADNPFYGGTTQQSTPEKNWAIYDNMINERRKRSR